MSGNTLSGASIEVMPLDEGDKPSVSISVSSEKPKGSPPKTTVIPKTDINQLAKRGELYFALGLIFFMVLLFGLGRIFWDERYYVPEEGLGYWLGLVGGVMMLLALGYGAIKHVPSLRTMGWMRRWLRFHIVLGIAGPILILIHSTFRLGSLNGAIALITMVLVFLSGIMGRYLYSKIHYGLGGKKAQIEDVQINLITAGKRIKSRRLDQFTESVILHPASLVGAWLDLMVFGWRSRWLSFQLRRQMKHHLTSMAKREGWSAAVIHRQYKSFCHQLQTYMSTLRKVALFSVYERFFSFWRHAHVPLLYLLFFSGIAHVIAVHMY